MEAAFEGDELLKLLTEALRRGPGSPQWQQAVQRIADPNLPNRDEYKLLITVRERLESGKPYREVRAGPSFTRSLFSKIDSGDTAPRTRGPVVPLMIALVSLMVLVGALSVLLSWMSHGGQDSTAALSHRLFITPLRQWDFSASLPTDLDRVGTLPLEIRGGVRPKGPPPAFPPVGAAFNKVPVDLQQSACIEAQVIVGSGPCAVGVFAGEFPPGSTGLGANELQITCVDGNVSAGFDQPGHEAFPQRPIAPGPHTLRLKLSPTMAIAEVDGQVIWSGNHSIGPKAIVGVRLTKPVRGNEPGVQSLRVLGP